MRIYLSVGIFFLSAVLSLSGCSLFGAAGKMDSRISEIDTLMGKLTSDLEIIQDPEERATITARIDLLRGERESLLKKKKIAEKAKETAGAGVQGILGILGVLLGVPLLGSAGAVAKNLITRGKG